jgi:hypothetical protein
MEYYVMPGRDGQFYAVEDGCQWLNPEDISASVSAKALPTSYVYQRLTQGLGLFEKDHWQAFNPQVPNLPIWNECAAVTEGFLSQDVIRLNIKHFAAVPAGWGLKTCRITHYYVHPVDLFDMRRWIQGIANAAEHGGGMTAWENATYFIKDVPLFCSYPGIMWAFIDAPLGYATIDTDRHCGDKWKIEIPEYFRHNYLKLRFSNESS